MLSNKIQCQVQIGSVLVRENKERGQGKKRWQFICEEPSMENDVNC